MTAPSRAPPASHEKCRVTLFSHVSNGMSTSWGEASGNGLVSVEWKFRGEPAHGANASEGLSALDAVQLMTAAMEYRREHLDVTQRTHWRAGTDPAAVPAGRRLRRHR